MYILNGQTVQSIFSSTDKMKKLIKTKHTSCKVVLR